MTPSSLRARSWTTSCRPRHCCRQSRWNAPRHSRRSIRWGQGRGGIGRAGCATGGRQRCNGCAFSSRNPAPRHAAHAREDLAGVAPGQRAGWVNQAASKRTWEPTLESQGGQMNIVYGNIISPTRARSTSPWTSRAFPTRPLMSSHMTTRLHSVPPATWQGAGFEDEHLKYRTPPSSVTTWSTSIPHRRCTLGTPPNAPVLCGSRSMPTPGCRSYCCTASSWSG